MTTIDDLPDEIIDSIFSRFDKLSDRLSVLRVCARWRRVCASLIDWRDLPRDEIALDARIAAHLVRLNSGIQLKVRVDSYRWPLSEDDWCAWCRAAESVWLRGIDAEVQSELPLPIFNRMFCGPHLRVLRVPLYKLQLVWNNMKRVREEYPNTEQETRVLSLSSTLDSLIIDTAPSPIGFRESGYVNHLLLAEWCAGLPNLRRVTLHVHFYAGPRSRSDAEPHEVAARRRAGVTSFVTEPQRVALANLQELRLEALLHVLTRVADLGEFLSCCRNLRVFSLPRYYVAENALFPDPLWPPPVTLERLGWIVPTPNYDGPRQAYLLYPSLIHAQLVLEAGHHLHDDLLAFLARAPRVTHLTLHAKTAPAIYAALARVQSSARHVSHVTVSVDSRAEVLTLARDDADRRRIMGAVMTATIKDARVHCRDSLTPDERMDSLYAEGSDVVTQPVVFTWREVPVREVPPPAPVKLDPSNRRLISYDMGDLVFCHGEARNVVIGGWVGSVDVWTGRFDPDVRDESTALYRATLTLRRS